MRSYQMTYGLINIHELVSTHLWKSTKSTWVCPMVVCVVIHLIIICVQWGFVKCCYDFFKWHFFVSKTVQKIRDSTGDCDVPGYTCLAIVNFIFVVVVVVVVVFNFNYSNQFVTRRWMTWHFTMCKKQFRIAFENKYFNEIHLELHKQMTQKGVVEK